MRLRDGCSAFAHLFDCHSKLEFRFKRSREELQMKIDAKAPGALLFVRILVIGLLAAGIPAWPQTAAKHTVTFSDLGTFNQVDNMQLSPDGKALAYVVSDNKTYPATDSQLWVVATKEGSTPKKIAQGTVPIWSPDSRRLAYYSGQPGNFQLWVLDVGTGK